MGHILNNTIQDVLIRKARMEGKNACWVPGTDHASIATEAKVVNMLREKGIAVSQDFDGPLRPGSVVFVETPEGVTHRDYVTHAWTRNPVEQVLSKMAATPALTRIAASSN